MKKTLQEYTTTELKALAYENIISIEIAQGNIKAINEELNKRAEQAQKPKEETIAK